MVRMVSNNFDIDERLNGVLKYNANSIALYSYAFCCL